jgi:ADP-heptose:LPS heptosyltransferase
MEWFYTHGYRVILDTPVEFYSLFQDHFFQIEHISQFVKGIPAGTRFINLDMAYEVSPQLPVLAAYYRVAGITDGQMRNAYLNFKATTETRLFDKYVVLHIDDTAMAHRNVHGVDWAHVSDAIDRMGYKPIQVGFSQEVGIQVKTSARRTLAHIVGGADAFIGIDSGCGQIAVACGIKTMLFFGSVNPEMRYPNMDNVEVVQNTCPVQRDGCYHKVISEVGQECTVDIKQPPCITHTTESVIKRIQNFLQQ